jgi:hypothetical protein
MCNVRNGSRGEGPFWSLRPIGASRLCGAPSTGGERPNGVERRHATRYSCPMSLQSTILQGFCWLIGVSVMALFVVAGVRRAKDGLYDEVKTRPSERRAKQSRKG